MVRLPFYWGSLLNLVWSGQVECLCFSVDRFDLLYVHATSGYQNNASTDYKDSTDDVEDCGTDATGGRKLCTGLVDYNDRGCCKLINGNKNSGATFSLRINNLTVFIEISCCLCSSCTSLSGSNSLLLSKLVVTSRSCRLLNLNIPRLNALNNN